MTALLEHQRVGRRPQALIPARRQDRSWRSVETGPKARSRAPVVSRTRRGSERLDELMRRQSPARMSARAVRRPARSHTPRVVRVSRVRVERRGRVAMALGVLASDARQYLSENWKILCAVTAAALGVAACILLFARLPLGRHAPGISLAPNAALDTLLLEGRMPERPSAGDTLAPAVVSILKVRQHDVQAGETISEIAARYKLKLGTIINFNGISDARSIAAGRKLSIPNADGLLHRVNRGDSLARIAKLYNVSANALMDWNDLQSAVIKAGQKLFVPGAALSDDEINTVLGKLFIYPTVGELTSGFGNRMSPIYKQVLFHNGIDLHNRTGTPVFASRAGRVSIVEINAVYGKTVIVAHSGGYQTMYAHLDTILVRRGQDVAQGAQLGTMGSTGSTTGPHLHFSIFRNSEPIDPLKLLH